MTLAHNVTAKLFVAFVVISMMLTAVAPAQAQTAEELQAQIATLMATINDLQSQLGQSGSGSVAAGVCPFAWTRSLSSGSTGADVMKLQQFLNGSDDTRVAATGAGSAGMETSYFGPATAAAVSKFQVKYREDILSPSGLVNPTGYFGPASMAKANMLCASASVDDGDDDEGDDEGEEEEEDTELQGEASLDNFELEDGESTIEEGDEDVVVGEITVEFADGDAEISRLDVALSASGADPWDAFEEVSLWVDGEEVASMAADDEDEYLDEDAGELRFADLGLVAREDEEMEISVAVTVQNNLDSEELTDWDLDATALRFFDADGVASTEDGAPVTDDTASFEIQTAGTDEELGLSLASSNPDGTDIVVDTDSDTNDVTILVADLEATDNDIELNRVVVLVETTNATTTDVVDEVRAVIDGQEFKAEAIGSEDDFSASADDDTPSGATGISEGYSEKAHATTSVWYLFDIDGDVVVGEDEEIQMEINVDFNDTDDGARYGSGALIQASITSTETDEWEAEGAEDLANGQFDGTAVGDEHTLVDEGIVIPVDGFSSEVDTLGTNDTIGEFVLEFEVTAVEGDFYITDNATTTTPGNPSNGIGYTASGGTAVLSASVTSTADEDTTGVFTVREGETETFTLTVTVDPDATGSFRVSLDEVWFTTNPNGTSSTELYTPLPASDFRTSPQSIQGS